MKLNVTLSEIDYKSIITAINGNAGRIFGALGLGSLDRLAVTAINGGENLIIKKIEGVCLGKGLKVDIAHLSAKKEEGQSLSVAAEVADVDLNSVVSMLLPNLAWLMKSNPQTAPFLKFITGKDETLKKTAATLFEGYSKEEQHEILAVAVNSFKSEISGAITDAARENGISFKIDSLTADN